jgi:hypothetical protein
MGVVALAERPGLLKWPGFFTLVPLTNYCMKNPCPEKAPLSYEALHEERVRLRKQLESTHFFSKPEQRAFARERFRILTHILNRMYIAKLSSVTAVASSAVGMVVEGEGKHGICKEILCKQPATKDYNGHGYWVCDDHNDKLDREFDEEYR